MNPQNPADPRQAAQANAWDPPAQSTPPPFSGFDAPTSSPSQADGSAFGGAPQVHASPPPFSQENMMAGGAPAPRQSSPPNGFDPPRQPAQAPPSFSPAPDPNPVISVHCPVCGHGLQLRRQHLGVEGECVSCGEGIVAVDAGPAGVVVERIPKVVSSPAIAPSTPPPAPEPEPEPEPESQPESQPQPDLSTQTAASGGGFDAPPPMVSWSNAPASPREQPAAVEQEAPPAWQPPVSEANSVPSPEPIPGPGFDAPSAPDPQPSSPQDNWPTAPPVGNPPPQQAAPDWHAGLQTPAAQPPQQNQWSAPADPAPPFSGANWEAPSAPPRTGPSPSPASQSSPAEHPETPTPWGAPPSGTDHGGQFSGQGPSPSASTWPSPADSTLSAATPAAAPEGFRPPDGDAPKSEPQGFGQSAAPTGANEFGQPSSFGAPAPGFVPPAAEAQKPEAEAPRFGDPPASSEPAAKSFGPSSLDGGVPGGPEFADGGAPAQDRVQPASVPTPSQPVSQPQGGQAPNGFGTPQPAAAGEVAQPSFTNPNPAATPSSTPAENPEPRGELGSQAMSAAGGNFGNLFASSPASREPGEAPESGPTGAAAPADTGSADGFASIFGNSNVAGQKGPEPESNASAPAAKEASWELSDAFGEPGSPPSGSGSTAPASTAGNAFGAAEKPVNQAPTNESASASDGFSSLFADSKGGDSAANNPWDKPSFDSNGENGSDDPGPFAKTAGNAGAFGSTDARNDQDSSAKPEFDFSTAPQPQPQAEEEKNAASSVPASAFTAPSGGEDRKRKKKKSNRVFSPLVIVVMILGALFLGAIYLLKAFGGVEGVKARLKGQVESVLSSAGQAAATAVEPSQVPQVAPVAPSSEQKSANPSEDSTGTADQPASSAPPASTESDNPPPATPVASPAAKTGNEPSEAPTPTEPDPLAPQPTTAEATDESGSEIPEVTTQVAPADTPPPAPATVSEPASSAPPAPPESMVEARPEPEPALVPETPEPLPAQPAPQAATDPNQDSNGAQAAAAVASPVAAASEKSEPEPEDPGKKMAAILEPVGTEVIESFYQARGIDERAAFVIDTVANQPKMEAYYRRYQELPTLRSVAFRGPMRDAASGRWFGVFDVRENENEEVHRWCVVQVRPGEMKLDWVIYQQLIDESLDRFLSDPASPPKEFRLVVRKGEEAPSDENPWPGTTWEVQLTPPLDTSAPRVILIKDSQFQELGLSDALVGGNARIGRVELSWVASDLEPLTRVPTVSKVLGWGAW